MSGTQTATAGGACRCCQRWNIALYMLDGDPLCLYCYDYVRALLDPYYGDNYARPARA